MGVIILKDFYINSNTKARLVKPDGKNLKFIWFLIITKILLIGIDHYDLQLQWCLC